MLCLQHFTLPDWIARKNGLLNRRYIIKHFTIYCQLIVKELGKQVDFWITINEPNVVAICGYFIGKFPPFIRSLFKYLYALETILRMHIAAIKEIRRPKNETKVGIAYAFQHFQPFNKKRVYDCFSTMVSFYLMTALFLNKLKRFEGLDSRKGNKAQIDYFGLNYYTTNYMKGSTPHSQKEDEALTDMNWAIYPEGMYDAINYVSNRFKKPIIITENGISTNNDNLRIQFIKNHLEKILRSINEGKEVLGYMYWSLTDNFEWDSGYSMRFGLVNIDYHNLKRDIKGSGFYYKNIISKNGLLE